MFHRLTALSLLAASLCCAQNPAATVAPLKIWDDKALADWATPVANLNVRPGHFSERDYYAAPNAECVRTYPVYFPGREPAGYWEMLKQRRPEPLMTAGSRTMADWVAAGKRVFEEMDVPAFRTYDPKLMEKARSRDDFAKSGGRALKDGAVFGMRWVPTAKGLALSIND